VTLQDALREAAALGVARLDAQLLLLHVLQRPAGDRAWLIAHDADSLAEDPARSFSELSTRRAAGEPLAYLVGQKEFFGLPLQVDARVLVPRPDTETLVEWALEVLQGRKEPRVIDLGTGSGAIALAIQKERPDARVEAVDRSASALEVARANAQRLALPVQFREADWLDGAVGSYDLIASNPPYVAAGDPHLPGLRHEPESALVAGADGLDDIRRIAAAAPARLAPGGWLLLEHGWDQAEAVRHLLIAAGLADVTSRKDLAGIARCSGGRRLELG
jgi:release factor glutamine methyltransferase